MEARQGNFGKGGMKRIAITLLAALTIAAQTTPHQATLTWTWTQGTGGPSAGFHVGRGPSGGPYPIIATVGSSAIQQYTDTASTTNVLNEGPTYCYTQSTMNSDGSDAAVVNGAIVAGKGTALPEVCGTFSPAVVPANPSSGLKVVFK